MPELDLEDSSSTVFSEFDDSCSCTDLHSQPSEAELAYAPAHWYGPNFFVDSVDQSSSTSNSHTASRTATPSLPRSPSENPGNNGQDVQGAPHGGASDVRADDLRANGGYMSIPGYVKDANGNTYAIQYVPVDPTSGQILPPQNNAEQTETMGRHTGGQDWPGAAFFLNSRGGFTDSTEVHYPVVGGCQETGRKSDYHLQVPWGHLVSGQEPAYQSLLSQPGGLTLPAIYVSPSGLLTVLLRADMAVEMTLDGALRVVHHRRKLAAAVSSRGDMSALYQHDVRVLQEGTSTEAALPGRRRALMTTENVYLASETLAYRMSAEGDLYLTSSPPFTDLGKKDPSVKVLCACGSFAPAYARRCVDVAEAASYVHYRNDAVKVTVNGVRIHQNSRDTVEVTHGSRFLRVSPHVGCVCVETHWAETYLERHVTVRVRRGGHHLYAVASSGDFRVRANEMEAGFDRSGHVYIQPGRDKHKPRNPHHYINYPAPMPGTRPLRGPRTAWPVNGPSRGPRRGSPGGSHRHAPREFHASNRQPPTSRAEKVRHAEFEEGETTL